MIREPAARHSQSDKDRRLIALAALAVLALGTYIVLSPFLVSIAWAIILVLVTWPLYRMLRVPLQNRPALAAGADDVAARDRDHGPRRVPDLRRR